MARFGLEADIGRVAANVCFGRLSAGEPSSSFSGLLLTDERLCLAESIESGDADLGEMAATQRVLGLPLHGAYPCVIY